MMTAAQEKITAYLQNVDKHAFFISVDGDEYIALKKFLCGLSTIRVSDFCCGDSFPDTDAFFDAVKKSPNDAVILGVGEAATLSGNFQIINRLRVQSFSRKIVVLCRGLRNFLEQEATTTSKFRRNFFAVDATETFSVVQYLPSLSVKTAAKNFRELLRLIEDGAIGTVEVCSELPLQKVLLLSTAYEVLKYKQPQLSAPAEVLSDDQWEKILRGESCESERKYLRGFVEDFANVYEQFAFERSANHAEFTRNIFFALLEIEPTERFFDEFYQCRKNLLKSCDEKILSEYVAAAKALGATGIFYLTDNTPMEFRAAMELAQLSDVNRDVLEKNFPALKKYLTLFKFDDERLTEYFRLYKELKIFNTSTEFLSLVDKYAEQRIFNEFETRQAILDRIGDAKLYWLDGLGVEFLSFVKQISTELSLSTRIQVARAELPTLTSINKNFFEEWPGAKFRKNERLDELRHGTRNLSTPLYFCDELFIIEDVLKEICQSLQHGESSKIILTSDHGSSRGAVTYRGKTWRMHSVGEHGGRCCLVDKRDERPICAAESNGYYSLSNYDRFQGGRLDGVELHGGATLEEVLIPVIEIFL